ncbi:hypothetical protein QBC46DRAFT_460654 [Diplogelasinospora grovesii]|uniref:Fucose-specific lectin n=1 Tax=Diplogelasinospora grovesii TaxID=303347 RepID=A0AAN6N3Z3_9PEZI|nr:hypothetical protein QBC46DRAFT_460654 [Diplogelasinospora grovesii]
MIGCISALAANGWRSSGDSDFSIRLSYQGPDNMLRYNQYSTIFGSWSPPHVIMAAAGAFPGTPLTATTIPYDMGLGYSQTQTELFWIASTNNRISGQNWRDGLPASGASDSIDSFMFTAGSGTRMASLWPSILVLDDNAQFKEVNYTSGIGFAASTLVTASSTPQPQQSSPLLALPRSTGHPGIEENVFYVSGNGALNVLARSASGAIVAAGKAFSMPANTSSLAGFAVAAKNTTDVISYVLWQDPSQGGIWMACLDPTAGGGWQSPTTDPVFADADVPTQLACVNVAVNWDGGSTMMPLLPNFDLSRCYFQAGGAIKEVLYDGTKWVDLGFIPMP